MIDPESLARSGREALDEDVGPGGEGEEGRAVGVVREVEDGAALAAIPGVVADLLAEGIVARALDADDVGAVVDEQHRRHGACDARRQVEHD